MNKQSFIELTGEDPEDMFGPDWENELLGLYDDEEMGGNEEEDN